ncbi:Na+/H+ antiporter NhaC family protein [Motilimonas pumila]|uniref:Na+/H+ antiporter NhaC family protein n=1 Tax=Motilimonas pumila TaxID=2303987 RepID=A0A418YGD8_9GAMM|nr:Na+/H+ antiporter NhaC family protein [Motilimonas pumila]RJG48670.1 Na+/H+ antiporter NhaC family protein [Motilimonas pumila]
MELTSYSQSILSLLPPVVAVLLAIITRKVLLSLGIGIILGALLLTNFQLIDTFTHIGQVSISLFWDDGALNSWNIDLIVFLLILGVMTSLLTISGATSAFANWASTKITSQRGSKILTVVLGIIIFIDDYFNSLAVGSICRPITDKYKVSRAKLAYLLDSTAAPMCVLMPISSWGAYIIGIIGTIFATHKLTEYTALEAFVTMIPMNLYAVFALFLVVLTAYFKLDIGAMKSREQKATLGELYNAQMGVPAGEIEAVASSDKANVYDLILPIMALIIGTVFFIIYTGINATEGQVTAISIFANTDASGSLVYGGLTGLAVTLMMALNNRLALPVLIQGIWQGCRAMLPAILILLFAWSMASMISSIETGKYLSSLADGNIAVSLLPLLLFILAGFMAFATGTSWGTFSIMLPIAADMAMGSNTGLLLPMMASVLAGAVFGDHCSPISDTTILSSTGAGCHHIEHVITQLPYALLVALISACGYLTLGVTESLWAGFIASGVLFIIASVSLIVFVKRKS